MSYLEFYYKLFKIFLQTGYKLGRDEQFLAANKAFIANLHVQKEQGYDTSTSHKSISKAHLKQIYENYFIPHHDNNDPICLQHKVWFDIAFFLGKRGVEGYRAMKKDSSQIKKSHENQEYLELIYNEATKKSQEMIIMK